MARKKRVTKKTSKTPAVETPISLPVRARIAWKNLLLFLVLFLASYVLYKFSETNLFIIFFGIMSVIFGFVAIAFLIAFIVLIITKSNKK